MVFSRFVGEKNIKYLIEDLHTDYMVKCYFQYIGLKINTTKINVTCFYFLDVATRQL